MRKALSIGLVTALALAIIGTSFFAGMALAQTRPFGTSATSWSSAASINPSPANSYYRAQWGWGAMSEMPWGGQPGMMNGCCGDGNWRDDWGMGRMGMNMMPRPGYWDSAPGLASTVPAPTTASISFQTDILPIFEARCVTCHGGTQGLFLTDYASVLHGSTHGPVVLPGDPAGSRLIQYVVNGYMPYGGPPLTSAQIQTLVNWVAAGALNN